MKLRSIHELFNNLTLTKKIFLFNFVIFVLILSMSTVSYFSYNRLSNQSGNLIKEEFPNLVSLTTIQGLRLNIQVAKRTLINSKIEWNERVKQYKAFIDSWAKLEKEIAQLEMRIGKEGELAKLFKEYKASQVGSKAEIEKFKSMAIKRDEYLSAGYSSSDTEVLDIESQMMTQLIQSSKQEEDEDAKIFQMLNILQIKKLLFT